MQILKGQFKEKVVSASTGYLLIGKKITAIAVTFDGFDFIVRPTDGGGYRVDVQVLSSLSTGNSMLRKALREAGYKVLRNAFTNAFNSISCNFELLFNYFADLKRKNGTDVIKVVDLDNPAYKGKYRFVQNRNTFISPVSLECKPVKDLAGLVKPAKKQAVIIKAVKK